MAKKKTWEEKLDNGNVPKVKRLEERFADIPAGATMVVATPLTVDQLIKRVPEGKSLSLIDVRRLLAKEFQADYACPVTTGMFIRIVAEAAYEQLQHGHKPEEITPFWRVIEPDSTTVKKLSFDYDLIRELRDAEGLRT